MFVVCELFFLLLSASVPELDLVFAIAATSSDGEEIYKLMKSTIQSIITNYGVEKIQYGIIHYGDISSTQVKFGAKFPSLENFKSFIDSLPRYFGGRGVDKALVQADQLFKGAAVRPNAKKVLVVMTDNASGRTTNVSISQCSKYFVFQLLLQAAHWISCGKNVPLHLNEEKPCNVCMRRIFLFLPRCFFVTFAFQE